MEEELVAGESPDKSVDEGTPGAASTSAESDPRLSVFRQRDPETPVDASADTPVDAEPAPDGSGGRDALRDAVAAWVATADDTTTATDSAPAGDRPAGEGRTTASRAAKPAAADSPSADSGSASEQPSGAQRTTSFRLAAPAPTENPEAAAPDTDSASPAAEPTAPVTGSASGPDWPTGDQRTTSFRLSAPAAAEAPEADAPGTDSASASGRPTGGAAPAAVSGTGSASGPDRPAGDQRTTSFRLSDPAAAEAPEADVPGTDSASASGRPAGGAAPAAVSGTGSVSGPDRPAGDQRTTSFRLSDPAAAEAPAADAPGTDSVSGPHRPAGDQRTTSFRLSEPAAAEAPEADAPGADSVSASGRPAGDQRTSSFRLSGPAASGSERVGGEAVEGDQRTTAFRAVKADSSGAQAAPEAGESERTAVFRAVRPAAPAGPAAGSASAGDQRKPAADSASAEGQRKPAADSASAQPKDASGDEPGDNERTAVFRAVKPAAAADAPVKEPAPRERTGVFRIPAADADDSERTATFRAVKPAAPAPAPAPADDRPADSAPAKASTFVPLRTDEPGRPQPKASAPGTAAPATAAPAAAAPAPASMDRTERTTQQPLPPKPPLDMLADLTNNPPPPPSPLRTAVRRFKIYFPLVVLLAIILAVVQLVRPLPEPKLVMTAKSSYTFDGAKPELPWPSEGQAYMAAAGLGTLGQSGEQKPVPIASVTKSMTAYIILRDHPIKKGEQGAMIDVDKTAETEGKKNDSVNNESTLDTVKEGDKISEYDAIAALMIPSANNIARLLARWDSGSQEAFVKKMNDTAKELGMTNTTYTDPSGLDATTVSTAEDQVKLGLKLVEIETLLDITKKPSWVDPSGKKWDNWNRLVPYNDSLGIKTGTTTKAGGNLLFAAQKKIGNTNQLIVGAVLGQHKPPIIDSVISASKQLMIATQKALEGAPVVKKGQVVGHVDDGLGGRTPVVATADVQAVGWASLTVNVKLADGGGKIPQTAKAGTEIGVLTVGEGASQVKVPVALQSELAAPGIGSKLTRVG
ncbi:hypothetical protein ACFXKW_30340 [Streptomyces sp. NPDC059193]|uniref:hypothetical protein n=1 Tax=Streptomyces sp. NPDC059193 TaxID=3346763 RepID=UPI00367C1207